MKKGDRVKINKLTNYYSGRKGTITSIYKTHLGNFAAIIKIDNGNKAAFLLNHLKPIKKFTPLISYWK